MKKYYYDNNEFDFDLKLIADTFKNKNIEGIIAPYRGGLPIGTKLSHLLNISLGVIQFQRLDGEAKNPIFRLAIEPFDKQNLTPFCFMKKILLVDDICDTGKTIEKIYKFLKILNPSAEIEIVTLFGDEKGSEFLKENIKDFNPDNFNYVNDIIHDWIVFPWETDSIKPVCRVCINGEQCNKDPEYKTHCNYYDKSYSNNYTCENFQWVSKNFYKKE